jgi:hypothetical protein
MGALVALVALVALGSGSFDLRLWVSRNTQGRKPQQES